MLTAVLRAYSSSVQVVACSRSLRKGSFSGSRGIGVTWRRYLHGAKSANQRLRRPTSEGLFVVRKLSEAPEDKKRKVVASVR